MENNKQTAVEWLEKNISLDMNPFELIEFFNKAKEMEKKQIMLGITKHLPIEDGVITAVQKAEQYYNEEYGGNNEQQ